MVRYRIHGLLLRRLLCYNDKVWGEGGGGIIFFIIIDLGYLYYKFYSYRLNVMMQNHTYYTNY